MCYGCWLEEDSPMIATLEVGQLAMNLQKADECGALHIFVGDWNCEDESIQFCHNEPEATEWDKALCKQALAMSYESRLSALALANNYWGAESIYGRHRDLEQPPTDDKRF